MAVFINGALAVLKISLHPGSWYCIFYRLQNVSIIELVIGLGSVGLGLGLRARLQVGLVRVRVRVIICHYSFV